MRNYIVLIVLFVWVGGSWVTAQKRSKLPRITVEAPIKNQERLTPHKPVLTESVSSVLPVTTSFEENALMADETTVVEQPIHQNQSYTSGIIHPRKSAASREKVNDDNSNYSPFTFSGRLLKSHTTLFKVKEVKKTALEVWVILLIVFYVLGLIFIVLCILALISWNSFTLFIVFLVLALLFSAAGSLMLTLGQMGVM